MTNKTTKRALFTSFMALLLCCSMLVGTTFAWFTDSVTSANNIIISGNLDVELYNGLDASDPDLKVDGYTKLFDDIALWEPGAVAYENLAVVNEGDLALKYQLTVNFTDATSTNDGKTLADVLKVAVVPGGFTGDREDAKALSYDYSLSTFAKVGELLVNAAPDVYGIVIYWEPTANDNSYNMNAEGQDPLEITLGVNLLATQLASEEDSFNNQYDKDATYYDVVSDPAEVAPNATEAASVSTDDVSLNIPAALINNLPTEVETVRVAHSEPVIDSVNNKLIFDAFEVIDQDGNIIDLAALNNAEEITVKLFVGDVFADGIMISVYHDGEKIADAEVIGGYATYTATHFCTLEIALSASVDKWDGTADTSWYNDTDTVFFLSSAEQLAGLAVLIDGGNTFENKTIALDSDVDLYAEDENGEPISFEPIGSYRNDTSFKGTFDGQGHTIAGLNQNTWALDNGYYYTDCGLGFFGAVEEGTVKNVTFDGAIISGESALCGVVAAVAHNATFENITVKNANCADYQYYAGGVVGWASGECNFVNCNIDATTNIAAQWGDFDNSIGGVIGGASGSAEILMKDCTVACRIDAYNDVTSSYRWYAYRRAGMLIGNSGKTTTNANGATIADAPQLTCENVTVIYNDWANYTYCEFAGTSWPYVRVQAGVSNSAYSNPRYGHPTDANGNEVVDDNHVHNDGEDHQILCVFDQLYGGGQGVYGCPTHDGVTVVYNNK